MISYRAINNCRCCESVCLDQYLDLGTQPLAKAAILQHKQGRVRVAFHHTEETKAILRDLAIKQHVEGRVQDYKNPERGAKISKSLLNHPVSQETRNKISLSLMGRPSPKKGRKYVH